MVLIAATAGASCNHQAASRLPAYKNGQRYDYSPDVQGDIVPILKNPKTSQMIMHISRLIGEDGTTVGFVCTTDASNRLLQITSRSTQMIQKFKNSAKQRLLALPNLLPSGVKIVPCI